MGVHTSKSDLILEWIILTERKFNGGPRICVGQQYAIIEASYIMLRLLQKYDKMENMDPEPEARYHSTMTSCSANGVKVKLHEA